MRLSHLGLALLVVLLAAGGASADFYKWTDERGQIHLTDDYYKVPPKYRAKAEVKRFGEPDSGVGAPPPLEATEELGPTGPSDNEPTTPTGEVGPGGGWQDWSGRGADYWTGRQRDLQARAQELERQLAANREAIEGLSSTRAAAVGGRRQRGRLEAESARLEVELAQVRKMLTSGLADEALRSGVPPDFATSLRGM
jgi:hypothetical protein